MRIAALPRADLIRWLYDAYYAKPKSPRDTFVSSYWQAQPFDVRMDERGNFAALKGGGFGDMMSRSPLRQLLAYGGHLSYLAWLPRRRDILGLTLPAIRIARAMGGYFSFDCFKSVCALELIMRHLTPASRQRHLNVLIIGDGYGYLASLIRAVLPDSTIALVDIGKTLLFQSVHCQMAHPARSHRGIHEARMEPAADFLYCPAEMLDQLEMSFDLAINIASMQEMDIASVERYFQFLRHHCRRQHLFYCCNRAVKRLPDGQTLEFERYPWRAEDAHVVDGPCPWYRYFFSYGRTKEGPRLCGIRVPLIHYPDGLMQHRLSILSVNPQ